MQIKLLKTFDTHMNHWLHDIWFRAVHGGRDVHRIELTNDRLTYILNNRVSWQSELDQIVQVDAFKRDMLTYDPVCLRLTMSNGGSFVLEEFFDGFEEVASELTRRLGIDQDWRKNVAVPAFATNLVLLWKRVQQR